MTYKTFAVASTVAVAALTAILVIRAERNFRGEDSSLIPIVILITLLWIPVTGLTIPSMLTPMPDDSTMIKQEKMIVIDKYSRAKTNRTDKLTVGVVLEDGSKDIIKVKKELWDRVLPEDELVRETHRIKMRFFSDEVEEEIVKRY